MSPYSPITEDGATSKNRSQSSITRRTALKRVGAIGLSLSALTVTGSAAADEDDYDTITVDAGRTETITLGEGETLENLLIDCTADGAHVSIHAMESDWTIRNVGIEGRVSDTAAVLGVADTGGGESTIENVYIGDGADQGHRVGIGMWVHPDHDGHLDVERVHIQEMGDNAFYASAPGTGGGGTVAFDSCYSANSWVSHYRLAEGTVENCVAVNDERHMDGRGVWAWAPGDVVVDGCDFDMDGRHYSVVSGASDTPSTVHVTDTAFTTEFHGGLNEVHGGTIVVEDEPDREPADELPEGCPASPEEAATGRADDDRLDGVRIQRSSELREY